MGEAFRRSEGDSPPRLRLVGVAPADAPSASIRGMHWLARLYAQRIVNVNVNIVLAGLLALPPVVLVVYLAQFLGLPPNHTFHIGGFPFFTISAITLAADLILDFSIYLVLHWLANHHPWRHRLLLDKADVILEPAHRGMSFMHDAGLVQFERAVLSPLLYLVWLGLQAFLIDRGVGAEAATAVGCVCGILTSRVLHTLWMLRQERRAHMRLITAAVVPQGMERAPNPPPTGSPSSADPASRTAAASRP